jgi:hypothetical protein
LTRALELYENMDIFVMGHIHENASRNDARDTVQYNPGKHTHEIVQKQIHLAITGAYKEEFEDGFGGWHVERGAPVKPTGGRILNLDASRIRSKEIDTWEMLVDSCKFPL